MVWYAIVEWPLFDAPSSTHGVFTSLVYLSAVAYIYVGVGIFQGSKVKDLSQIATFYDFVWYAIIEW